MGQRDQVGARVRGIADRSAASFSPEAPSFDEGIETRTTGTVRLSSFLLAGHTATVAVSRAAARFSGLKGGSLGHRAADRSRPETYYYFAN